MVAALVSTNPKTVSLLEARWFLPVSILLNAAGLGSLWLTGFPLASTAAFSLFSATTTLLVFYWLEIISLLTSTEITWAIIAATLMDIPLVWLINTVESQGFLCVFFLLASYACMWYFSSSRLAGIAGTRFAGKATRIMYDSSTDPHEKATGGLRLDKRILIDTLIGLFLVGLAVAFTQTAALQSGTGINIHSEFCLAIVFVTLIYLLCLYHDINLTMAIKAICTLTMAALLTLMLSIEYAYLAYALSSIAYGILTNVAYFAAAMIVKARTFVPLRAFGFMGFMLSGSSLVLFALELANIDATTPLAICILAFAFVYAVVWLLGNRGVDMLLAPAPTHADQACHDSLGAFEKLARNLGRSAGLTPRETDIMALYSTGRSAPFIAEKLTISENTVKSYLQRVYAKCEVHSRQELISLIERQGAIVADGSHGNGTDNEQ